MIVEPRIRGFICTTAHPAGCRAAVKQQADVARRASPIGGVRKALVIGGSTGYGLATRLALGFGGGAATLNIALERPGTETRTASAGWYNTAAAEEFARAEGLYAKSILGDAYAAETKQKAVETIARDLGKVDLVVYSLAAPRRSMPDGSVATSALKVVGKAVNAKTLDLRTDEVVPVCVSPATDEEIDGTIAVMGGADWSDWIDALAAGGVLCDGARTVAYSYIGPRMTYPIYRDGTIGLAKRDLAYTAKAIGKRHGIDAFVSVNKAVVTQASAAIPIVPLYLSMLIPMMKQAGTHEECIDQMCRLFASPDTRDEEGFVRLDDRELDPALQKELARRWQLVTTETLPEYADVAGYKRDFRRLFGFDIDGVDYAADVDPVADLYQA